MGPERGGGGGEGGGRPLPFHQLCRGAGLLAARGEIGARAWHAMGEARLDETLWLGRRKGLAWGRGGRR